MSSPKVSIIVPVYQTEPYIKQCVDSLLGQTLKDIEIILINDGSPDGCPQICDQYAAQDSRVRVFHQENAGVSRARNIGIEMAAAEWIMFVDPDDWLERDAVEVLFRKASECGCDIIYSSFYWSYENRELPVKVAPSKRGEFHVPECYEFFLDTLMGYRDDSICMAAPWAKLYKKELIESHHCRFPEGVKRRQDAIFNLYLSPHVSNIYIIDIPTYHYRQRESSVRHRLAPDQQAMFRRFNKEIYLFLQRFHLWPAYEKQYHYVVLQGIFDLCTLCAESIDDRLNFNDACAVLRSFCEEEDCKAAIRNMSVTEMRGIKEMSALWLLKRRMYGTIIRLLIMRKRCSQMVRSA